MNSTAFPARWQAIALFVISAIFLAGCAATRQGVSWPALSTVTIDGETKILIAYTDRVEVIEPSNGNLVPVLDDSGQRVIDQEGRAVNWVMNGGDFEGAQFFASPALIDEGDEQTLLFPTYSNLLVEVGVERPDTRLGVPISINGAALAEAVVTDEFIYVPYRTNNLVAIERDTLEVAWTLVTEGGVWAQPLLIDEVLYVTTMDHRLYAVDAVTGEQLWNDPVSLEGAIASTPLFVNDYFYVGSYDHRLYQISLDGEVVAQYEGNNWIWGTPVIFEDTIYYADLSGYVYALDAETLGEVWVVQPATRGIRPAPVVSENFVVVASRDGRLYWLDRLTGELSFEREFEGTPELLSDLLLIEQDEASGIDESIVVAASVDTGRLVAAFTLDNSLPIWVYGR